MAPARRGLKCFYRQRKKKGGVAKPSTSPNGHRTKTQQCNQDGGYVEEEGELRRFDMDMTYGPCIGVTRLRRWEAGSTSSQWACARRLISETSSCFALLLTPPKHSTITDGSRSSSVSLQFESL